MRRDHRLPQNRFLEMFYTINFTVLLVCLFRLIYILIYRHFGLAWFLGLIFSMDCMFSWFCIDEVHSESVWVIIFLQGDGGRT